MQIIKDKGLCLGWLLCLLLKDIEATPLFHFILQAFLETTSQICYNYKNKLYYHLSKL